MSLRARLRTLARIEVRHTRDDGFVVSMWRRALHQSCHPDRDAALDLTMTWCRACWADDVEVELAEYDLYGTLRWSVRELRSLDDLRRYVDRLRDVRERAEAAAREAAA